MADVITGGVIDRGSEFIRTIPNGPESSRIFAFCGGRSLTSVLCAALNRKVAALDVYNTQRAHSLCDPNGASTTAGLHSACDLWGLTHTAWHDYDLGWRTGSWRADVLAQAQAGNPGVLMLHAGQQLLDLISGLGENGQNIEDHFIGWLGYHPGGPSDRAGGRTLPEGLWCADGANYAGGNDRANGFNAANVLQFYTITNLQAAWPCGFVAVKGYGEAQKPMGWTKTANGATDDQGHATGTGIADVIFTANLQTSDGLMSETYYGTTQSFVPLANGAIVSWDGHAAHTDQGAQVLAAVWAEMQALKNAPPTPPPAPDPLATAALAMLSAQKAFFAKLP